MAESWAAKKLEDQLTCAICLDVFKDPKLLKCFHVYCKDCLQRLVVQDRQGQLSLSCPTCRQSTLLPPATGVSGLPPAFHVHRLQEMMEISAPKKVTLYCSLHKEMKLDFYCETCAELICFHCTVYKHCRPTHKYDLVGDIFERHKGEITASLEPVEQQLGVVGRALEQFDLRSQELDELEVAMEDNIGQQIRQLQELLEVRKAELVGQMKQHIQTKRKNLAAQKDEVETVHTQLVSCLSFVKDSLRTGSQGEVMKMKKAVVNQIKEMTDNFKPDMLPPCELANIKFIPSPELTQACQQFGRVFLQQTSPEKCFTSGTKGQKTALIPGSLSFNSTR